MRFTTNTNDFSVALGSVAHFLPSRAVVPALSCVLLEADAGSLILCGTDRDNIIRVVVPALVDREGTAAVPARYLADVLHRFSAGTVQWDLDPEHPHAILTWKRTRVTVQGMPPAEYPLVPQRPEKVEYTYPQRVLRRAIQTTAFAAAAPDAARLLLTGIELRFSADHIQALTTDGFHAAVFASNPAAAPGESSIVVPAPALAEAARLLADSDDPVDVSLDASHLWVGTAGVQLGLRLLEGKYFAILDLVPKTFATTVSVSRAVFIGACARVGVVTEAHPPHAVTAEIGRGGVRLHATFPSVGSAEEEIDARVDGEYAVVAFNAQAMLAALSRFQGENLRWEISGSNTMARVSAPDDRAVVYMHMPLEITNAAVGVAKE